MKLSLHAHHWDVMPDDSYFFFSSGRRHTRWPRDWSSDVCSSDLEKACRLTPIWLAASPARPSWSTVSSRSSTSARTRSRSEERRVGKECRDLMTEDT